MAATIDILFAGESDNNDGDLVSQTTQKPQTNRKTQIKGNILLKNHYFLIL